MHITNFVFHKKNDHTPDSIFDNTFTPLTPTNAPIHSAEPTECHWCGYHLLDETKDCPNCENNNTHPKQPIPTNNEEENNDFFALKKIEPLPVTHAIFAPEPASTPTAEPLECAWCSYPLNNIEKDCPNCGYNAADTQEATLPKMQLIHQKDDIAYSFEGDKITIHNENLQNNADEMPISSDIAAQFECIDGVWYLSNENATQPIFIQVTGKTPISQEQMVLINQQIYLFQELTIDN
jgi:hypothetical protein